MRARQDYLFHHPLYLESCQLPACPTHGTLGRRYKMLTPQLQAFTEYIAALQFATEAGFLQEVVYEDKSRFKAAGPRLASAGSSQGSSPEKLAIEPVFDLLSKLLSITGAHKPLPM